MTAALDRPVSVPVRVQMPELSTRIKEADDNQVYLTIGVDRVEAAGESIVHVFLNKDDANAKTLLSDSHYVGSFAFFCHRVDANSFVCEIGSGERTEPVPLQHHLGPPERGGQGGARVTFVVVPIDGRRPRAAGVGLSAVGLTLAKSVVKR